MSTALIVIDVQEEYFSGRLPIEFPPRESSLGLITTAIAHMTNVCCDTTARQAIHRGLGATLLHDAAGVPMMRDIDGNPVAAEVLQRVALAPLALMGVEMASTGQWVQGLVPESGSSI